MTVKLLKINNFRNLACAELTPFTTGLNILYGNNGSGKTSLLEAIYYLGLGRSFRSSTLTRLIRHQEEKFSLFAQIMGDSEQFLPVGVEREQNGVNRLRIAEKDVANIAELAYSLPLRVINSHSHQLFESGPLLRRKYLDWGLFYYSPQFLSCWRHFERVLKQRNTILRERRSKKELESWTEELVKYGLALDLARKDYVEVLLPYINQIVTELLPLPGLTMLYQSGWKADKSYLTVLQEEMDEEFRLGYTHSGPHRADLHMTIDKIPVKHILSRGQQKLLICAMIVAQGALLADVAKRQLVYLVDDLPAELDEQSRHRLIALLAQQKTQVFITAIESAAISDVVQDKLNIPFKVFHVEHGNVTEMA